MFGVIQRNYDAYRDAHHLPRQSVRLIAQNELRDIYRQYWDGTCDRVALNCPLTALCLFDLAINAGPGTVRKLLQRALDLNEPDHAIGDVDDDGKLGPQTYGALSLVTDDQQLCVWLLMERVRFYDDLADSPRLRPNLKSWIHRTIQFYDKHIRP
jgi:lysozyme family protein